MSSENDPEFDEARTSAQEDMTEHLPEDPGKTWVPADREANQWADTGDFPNSPPETEAGSLGGLEPSFDDEESPSPAAVEAEPPRQFGEYELLDRVGRGGMGIVYKARDRRLDRIVALKILKAGTTRSEKQVERFVREAKAAARLDHPNIVPCYEFGEFQGWHYLTMAFVNGDSLQRRLHNGPMNPRDAALMIRDLASAISHAHKQGVIHRDIKPGNVILGDDGRPRLADFGIAKLLDPTNPPIAPTQLTMVGQALGTPGYMAPEQSAGRRWEIGPAVDIYALGGVLVAALTGHPAGGDSLETLAQDVPDDLHVISNRCLAYNPLDRYATADTLLIDLEAYLEGDALPPTLPPDLAKDVTITLPELTIKFSKSKIWIIVGFIFAVLICSLLLATWFTDGWRNTQPPRPQDSSENGPGNPNPQIRPRRNPPDDAPVRSHMEVLVDRGTGQHRPVNHDTPPLGPEDKIFVDVKVDRDQNAHLYVIRVDTLGKASLVNEEKPIELSPFGGHMDYAPDDLEKHEHFGIRAEAKEYLNIPHTGPAGMMTLVLLSRKDPLEGESLNRLKEDLKSFSSQSHRNHLAPTGSSVHRFSVRQHQPPIPRIPSPDTPMWKPLSNDHPVIQTLSELLPVLTPHSKHIDAVSVAVPDKRDSETKAEN